MTYRFITNILVIVFVLILELIIYFTFIKPQIIGWGASTEEFTMEMAGDSDKLEIVSTRGILINAPKEVVWKWLMQLGADRGGFYSYDFIELALGYKTNYPELSEPSFGNLKKGDIVRGSTNETDSVIPYNFNVLYVEQDKTFVLENWGTFLLKRVNDETTRLIIRTQELKSDDLLVNATYHLALPFHFIMERRMMFGFKMKAEVYKDFRFSHTKDIFWFSCVILSWCMIFILAFVIRGGVRRITIPTVLGALWLSIVFIFPPLPIYSVVLLVMILFVFISQYQSKSSLDIKTEYNNE